jgi:hypothetical protein
LLATLVGVGLVWLAIHYLPMGSGIVAGLGMVVLYGGLAMIVVFVLCWLMRVPEMQLVTSRLSRIFKRR